MHHILEVIIIVYFFHLKKQHRISQILQAADQLECFLVIFCSIGLHVAKLELSLKLMGKYALEHVKRVVALVVS